MTSNTRGEEADLVEFVAHAPSRAAHSKMATMEQAGMPCISEPSQGSDIALETQFAIMAAPAAHGMVQETLLLLAVIVSLAVAAMHTAIDRIANGVANVT